MHSDIKNVNAKRKSVWICKCIEIKMCRYICVHTYNNSSIHCTENCVNTIIVIVFFSLVKVEYPLRFLSKGSITFIQLKSKAAVVIKFHSSFKSQSL